MGLGVDFDETLMEDILSCGLVSTLNSIWKSTSQMKLSVVYPPKLYLAKVRVVGYNELIMLDDILRHEYLSIVDVGPSIFQRPDG